MMHSILLIGQSNMAGRGFLNEAPKLDNPKLKVLRNGRWQPMYRPVNGDRPFSGSNLVESFADKYANDFDVDTGVIPCADGGTSLNQWAVGGLLFDHACYMAELASRTSTIAAVLWHQGESDCADDLHPLYEEKLTVIIDAFRKKLDLCDVPFLLGGLGDYLKERNPNPNYQNIGYINNALQRIAEKDSMIGFVPATGLGSNPDNLHFNAAALYEFGLRYYDEFLKLRNPDKVYVEKPHPDDAFRTDIDSL